MEAERSPLAQLDEEIKNASNESLAGILKDVKAAFEKKHWHQFTDGVERYYLENPTYSPEGEKSHSGKAEEFFRNVIHPIRQKISPLRFVLLLQKTIPLTRDTEAAVGLVEKYKEEFKTDADDAKLLLSCLEASLDVKGKKYSEAREKLESVQNALDSVDAGTEIQSTYHRVWADLAKAREQWNDFVASSLLWLAYTPMTSLREYEKEPYAAEISVAALTASNFYNFGELISQPLLDSMKGKSSEWLLKMLDAFEKGDLSLFDSAINETGSKLSTVGLQEEQLRSKMTLLSLMDLAFRLSKPERRIPFSTIASHCRLKEEQVERIAMKAMAADLIKGDIDEIEKIVRITWVRPRVLDNTRMKMMHQRLTDWVESATTLLSSMEEAAPALLVS